MNRASVELKVGGQTYRVVTSAEEDELRRLASVVDERLRELTAPGRQVAPQTMLLAAIALAHDLEAERARRREVEARSREMLQTLLARIDAALESAGEDTPEPAEAEAPDSPEP
jgi:cell division protein ZapA